MNKPFEPSRRSMEVWKKLIEWYGIRVVESYGAKPNSSWDMAINSATNEQVVLALQSVRLQHGAFPPTFPQFEALLVKARPASQVSNYSLPTQVTEKLIRKHSLGLLHLSPRQLKGPWRWEVTWQDGQDKEGRHQAKWEPRFTKLVIDADDDAPEYRINIQDLLQETYNIEAA